MNLGLPNRARERLQSAADYAKDALDSGLAVTGEKARSYADKGIAQLDMARGRLPASFQRPSTPMVLTALGAGLLIGLLLGGKASTAIEDMTDAGKSAIRRRRLNAGLH